MTDKERFKFNIQLFGGAEGGDTGGEPTPNPEPTVNTGAGGEPPQPSGDNGAGAEPKVEPLTWEGIKAEDYQEIGDIAPYIAEAQEKGYTPEYIKSRLDDRKAYLAEQKAAFTPELNASMEAINNFIGAEKDTDRQIVYRAMAENAIGAQILKEYIEMKAGSTGSVVGVGAPTGQMYTRKEFIEAYNKAKDTNDNRLMDSLKTYARSKKETDPYFWDFIN
jgi:hypothetical protein